jgi:hypothetical protein
VAEQIAAKVGDDALLEFGVHVAVQYVDRAADNRDAQAGDPRSAPAAETDVIRVRRVCR